MWQYIKFYNYLGSLMRETMLSGKYTLKEKISKSGKEILLKGD